MDADALVDREAPTPIHWTQTRRVLVARMQGFINERDGLRTRLADVERERDTLTRQVKVLREAFDKMKRYDMVLAKPIGYPCIIP